MTFLQQLLSTLTNWLWQGIQHRLGSFICLALLLIISLVVALIVLALTAPLRQQERARCLLNLLETGLARGQSPEQTIVSLSQAQVQAFGAGLHLLAAHVVSGLRLGAALERVPGFLPAVVGGLLQAGETLGDLRQVLPACRAVLQRPASASLVTQNSVIALLTVLPAGVLLNWAWLEMVLPKFREITMDLLGPGPFQFCAPFAVSCMLGGVLTGVWLLWFAVAGLPHLAPRWFAGSREGCWPALDRLDFLLPWREKRMRRDFSSMLALLLDAGVPEARALRQAAAVTANRRFMARAERAQRRLAEGSPLPEALRELDEAGEFHWRLRNAARAGRGVVPALEGWHEALEARAFQQEQTASNLFTGAFVLANGCMVGLLAVGVFLPLIWLMREVPLW